jgi:hypothetical protein
MADNRRVDTLEGMPIDPQQVGAMALDFMEHLEQQHGEAGGELDAIAFIAAVDFGDGHMHTHFSFRNGDGTPLPRYRGLGLLAEVERSIQ